LVRVADLVAAAAAASERAAAAVRHRTAIRADALASLGLTNRRAALTRHPTATARGRRNAATTVQSTGAAVADGAAGISASCLSLGDAGDAAVSTDVGCSAAAAGVAAAASRRTIGNLIAAAVRHVTTITLWFTDQRRFAGHRLTTGLAAFARLFDTAHFTRGTRKATVDGASAAVTDWAA